MKSKIPNHYKLIKEHPHSYEIHDGKDGRSFHIAKAGLDLGMHGKLSKIQKYSKGSGYIDKEDHKDFPMVSPSGDIIQKEGSSSAPFNLSNINPALLPTSGLPDKIDSNVIPQTAGSTKIADAETVAIDPPPQDAVVEAPKEAVKQESQGMASPLDKSASINALDAEKRAIESSITAQNNSAIKRANAYKDYAEKVKKLGDPIAIREQKKERSDKLLKAYVDHTIDRNRVTNNMGTGEKIRTIIGLVFGGLGAGQNGENPGITMLNKQIEDDLELQKNDRTKAYNLYQMNREATKDEREAALNYREQMWNVVQAEALEAQASASGPIAAAQSQQLISAIEQKKNSLINKQSLLSAASTGRTLDVDPAYYLNEAPDASTKNEMTKEITQMKKLKTLKDDMMNAQEKLEKLALGGMLSYKEKDALVNAFVPQLAVLLANKYTEQDAASIVKAFLKTGVEGGGTTQLRRSLLDQAFNGAITDTAFKGATGVGLDSFKSTRFNDSPLEVYPGLNVKKEQAKQYIKKNINSNDPKIKSKVQFLIQELGL